ncbi:MAG: hypothetical protein QNJ84_04490 [Alphaproteobacteria bacterium]|nr:hypothetical protein [Alphaproteobacteria bacterium]
MLATTPLAAQSPAPDAPVERRVIILNPEPSEGDPATVDPAAEAASEPLVPAAPLSLVPQGFSDLPEEAPAPSVLDAPPEGIFVRTLRQVDPEAVGTLDAANGGFPVGLWAGTERSVIDGLVPKLAPAPGSAAQFDITRRLLLTRAALPAAPGLSADRMAAAAPSIIGADPSRDAAIAQDAAAASDPTPRLLQSRLDLLRRMGLLSDVADLIAAAPSRAADAAVQKSAAEALLLSRRSADACALARSARFDDRFWLRLGAYCLYLDGDRSGAQFNVTLLTDEAVAEDAAFLSLMDRLLGGPARPPASAADLGPLEAAMLADGVAAEVASIAWPSDALQAPDPAVRSLALSDRSAPLEIRIEALEDLFLRGLAPADRVSAAYAEASFPDDMFEAAFTAAQEMSGPLARALFFQAIGRETSPAVRAELIAAALRIAEQSGRRAAMLGVLRPAVREIDPARTLWWFSADAIAALAAGLASQADSAAEGPADAARIRAWARILRDESVRDPSAEAAALDVWPIVKIYGDSALDRAWTDPLAAWSERVRRVAPETATQDITRVLLVLEALGQAIPEQAWTDILLEAPVRIGRTPNPILIRRLTEAAAGRRQGEALLLSLILLGQPGPAGAEPAVLSDVTRALFAVGLAREARALALEAVAAAG